MDQVQTGNREVLQLLYYKQLKQQKNDAGIQTLNRALLSFTAKYISSSAVLSGRQFAEDSRNYLLECDLTLQKTFHDLEFIRLGSLGAKLRSAIQFLRSLLEFSTDRWTSCESEVTNVIEHSKRLSLFDKRRVDEINQLNELSTRALRDSPLKFSLVENSLDKEMKQSVLEEELMIQEMEQDKIRFHQLLLQIMEDRKFISGKLYKSQTVSMLRQALNLNSQSLLRMHQSSIPIEVACIDDGKEVFSQLIRNVEKQWKSILTRQLPQKCVSMAISYLRTRKHSFMFSSAQQQTDPMEEKVKLIMGQQSQKQQGELFQLRKGLQERKLQVLRLQAQVKKQTELISQLQTQVAQFKVQLLDANRSTQFFKMKYFDSLKQLDQASADMIKLKRRTESVRLATQPQCNSVQIQSQQQDNICYISIEVMTELSHSYISNLQHNYALHHSRRHRQQNFKIVNDSLPNQDSIIQPTDQNVQAQQHNFHQTSEFYQMRSEPVESQQHRLQIIKVQSNTVNPTFRTQLPNMELYKQRYQQIGCIRKQDYKIKQEKKKLDIKQQARCAIKSRWVRTDYKQNQAQKQRIINKYQDKGEELIKQVKNQLIQTQYFQKFQKYRQCFLFKLKEQQNCNYTQLKTEQNQSGLTKTSSLKKQKMQKLYKNSTIPVKPKSQLNQEDQIIKRVRSSKNDTDPLKNKSESKKLQQKLNLKATRQDQNKKINQEKHKVQSNNNPTLQCKVIQRKIQGKLEKIKKELIQQQVSQPLLSPWKGQSQKQQQINNSQQSSQTMKIAVYPTNKSHKRDYKQVHFQTNQNKIKQISSKQKADNIVFKFNQKSQKGRLCKLERLDLGSNQRDNSTRQVSSAPKYKSERHKMNGQSPIQEEIDQCNLGRANRVLKSLRRPPIQWPLHKNKSEWDYVKLSSRRDIEEHKNQQSDNLFEPFPSNFPLKKYARIQKPSKGYHNSVISMLQQNQSSINKSNALPGSNRIRHRRNASASMFSQNDLALFGSAQEAYRYQTKRPRIALDREDNTFSRFSERIFMHLNRLKQAKPAVYWAFVGLVRMPYQVCVRGIKVEEGEQLGEEQVYIFLRHVRQKHRACREKCPHIHELLSRIGYVYLQSVRGTRLDNQ